VGGLQDLFFNTAPGGALVSLIVFAVLAVWRGWLVPRGTLDRIAIETAKVEAVQAQRLADSQGREEEWRAAWTAERARGDLQADQIGELLELARTTDASLRGMRTAARGESA
jgi:hypothetical protein